MSEEKKNSKQVEEVREENLPLDARLLSDAVIELNISRRNVGLYPPGHVRITSAIDRAFDYLTRLFELRPSIALGITKDALVIDGKVLDSRNPVFRECARSFHVLGIAGITFTTGVAKEELVSLHELMTHSDPPTAKAFVEAARERNIVHLKLNPIDYSSFKFMEDSLRSGGKGGHKDLWEDYVYGLMHGNLAVGDAADDILKAPPKELAEFIEEQASKDESLGEEAYDRVVATYMSTHGDMKLSGRSLQRLVSLMDNLSPEKKKQFLDRAMLQAGRDISQVEEVLHDMTSKDLGTVTGFFKENEDGIPSSFRNLIDKFTDLAREKDFSFDVSTDATRIVHDIELSDDMADLFREDQYEKFVSTEFQAELARMVNKKAKVVDMGIKELETDVRDDVVDRYTSDILLEVMELSELETDEFMRILTTLSKMSGDYVDTGRFEDALNVLTAIHTHAFNGKFKQAAQGTVDYFYKGEDFLARVMTAARLWGRTNREEVTRLIRALRAQLIEPLLDALAEEKSASIRKFLLTVLSELGSDIMPGVLSRLRDKRWYVVRNMLILTARCGRPENDQDVRKLIKYPDRRVWVEALRALFTFKSRYAVPHLKVHLSSDNPEDRAMALKVAGAYQVKDSVPILLEWLGKKDMLGTGAFDKVAVVKALGEIGDPEVLPHLDKVLHSKPLLFKGYHDDLRTEIYRSLPGYPFQDVQYLFDEGLMDGIAEIRNISKQAIQLAAGKAEGSDG